MYSDRIQRHGGSDVVSLSGDDKHVSKRSDKTPTEVRRFADTRFQGVWGTDQGSSRSRISREVEANSRRSMMKITKVPPQSKPTGPTNQESAPRAK